MRLDEVKPQAHTSLQQMRIVHGYQQVPPEIKGAALAIGNFDGVHRGHQALLLTALKQARATGRPAGVMVFEPHPREFFRPDEPHFTLTTLQKKVRLIERLGLDFVIVLTFDASLAGLPAARFIDEVLVGALQVSHVVIGHDFFFGKGRGGNPEVMRAAGREHGFGVTVIPPVAEAGEVFSSSGIRAKLSAGDVRGAALDLGHWWRVAGRVTGGAKRGTGLGFPTANIVLPKGTALAHGIYAVRVYIAGERYSGAAYLGTRPTFDHGAPVLEVFLFDFEDDLYGKEIEVEFLDFIRGDQRFPDAQALIAQMQADCARAREIIAAVDRQSPLAGFPLAEG
jgi:riboflavin kinase/FMN adenylyltransferase